MPKSILTNAKNIRQQSAPLKDINFQFKPAGDNAMQAEMNDLIVGVMNLQREDSQQIDVEQLQQELDFLDELTKREKTFNKALQAKSNDEQIIQEEKKQYQARLNEIQKNIALLEEQKKQATDDRTITKLNGYIIENEDAAEKGSSHIEKLNEDENALTQDINALKDEQNNFLNDHADKIAVSERSASQLKASIELIDTTYKQAIQKDKEMAKLVKRLAILSGVTVGLAALALLGYFLPFIVAGALGIIVGILPAAIILVLGLLIVGVMATSNGGSSVTIHGSVPSNDIATLFKGLIEVSTWLGMKTYSGALIAMPYITIAVAVAAVGSLIATLVTAIQLAVVKHQKDAFFENTFSDGLKNNSLFKTSNTKGAVDTNNTPNANETTFASASSLG